MKKTLRIIALAAAFIGAVACTEKENQKPSEADGLIILNSGSMGKNDSSIKFYSDSENYDDNAFFSINGQHLGDTANDMIRVGDKIYIAVTNSKTIFVTDLNLKIVKKIGVNGSPRRLASDGSKVYVTLYEGQLGLIDLESGSVKTTAVGPNPEGLAILNGKIYVANSGGMVTDDSGRYIYDNTLSVVDATLFQEERRITVNTNPSNLVAFEGKLYCHSLGDYGTNPAKLQVIDLNGSGDTQSETNGNTQSSTNGKTQSETNGNTQSSTNSDTQSGTTETVTDLSDGSIPGLDSPSGLASDGNGTIYVLCGKYDSNWTLVASVYSLDASSSSTKLLAENISEAYSICADANSFYVTTSNYKDNGNVLVYSSDGKKTETLDCGGVNPIRVIDNR